MKQARLTVVKAAKSVRITAGPSRAINPGQNNMVHGPTSFTEAPAGSTDKHNIQRTGIISQVNIRLTIAIHVQQPDLYNIKV